MSAMPVIVVVLCLLAIAYRFYAKFLAVRVAGLDDSRFTPAVRLDDGKNDRPTRKWVLFGQYFAAISGAGPLIDPVLAAQFAYMPGLGTATKIWNVIDEGSTDSVAVTSTPARAGYSLLNQEDHRMGRLIRSARSIRLKTQIAIAFSLFVAFAFVLDRPARADSYQNFSVCVYFRYQETQSIPEHLEEFARRWADVTKQVKVSKVYLETTRNGQLATDEAVNTLKKFFTDQGIKVSGGMGLTVQESNRFQSYCYTSPADRDKVKAMSEFTARHFDEIILDDFYFNNTKNESDIIAKGDKSWTEFRTGLMDDVSKNLIIGPAKAVNPNVHVIIKYPNWYESFQGLGYDLAVEPKLFDAIYTGTETRGANQGQRLQSYQSYLQPIFFSNIKPGGNQGGWIDGGQDVDRYAEQFWDTLFAKVPEIMLFNSLQIMARLNSSASGASDPNATLAHLAAPTSQPGADSFTPSNVARIAGYSAEILDGFLGKLGKPIGVATYKPLNSVGEEYLPNFFGMIGVPIDLVPEFPENASTVFLTASSAYDNDLVAKTEKFVRDGGRAIVTTGLVDLLGKKGFQNIAEIEVTGNNVLAKNFNDGRGNFRGNQNNNVTTAPVLSNAASNASAAAPASAAELNILIPQMRHFENDTWPMIPFNTASYGYPMAISASYGKGTFYILAIPDDFADLYRLPQSVLMQLRQLLASDLFVSLDAPDHVGLFAYDNHSFIVQNFQAQPVTTRVTVEKTARLHDLISNETLAAAASTGGGNRNGARRGDRRAGGNDGTQFVVEVPAHSFRVFTAD